MSRIAVAALLVGACGFGGCSSAVDEVRDSPPTAPEVVITPDLAYDCHTLTCDLVEPGVDPEGRPVSHTYTWYVDGVATPAEGDTLAPGTAMPGQEVHCEVEASDGTHTLPPVASDAVVVADDEQTEDFVPTGEPLDVLLVIDNSCSMAEEQRELREAAEDVLEAVESATSDFQVAVVSTDNDRTGPGSSGRFAEAAGISIVTPATPEAATVLGQLVTLGLAGSSHERPIEAVVLSMSEPTRSTDNDGFFRPGTGLAIVIVTDEPDGSPQTAAGFVDFLDGDRGGPDLATVYAIIGGPDGCSGDGGTADPARKLTKATTLSGGTWFDICAPGWDAYFHDIASSVPSAPGRTYPLSYAHVPGSLTVDYTDWSGTSVPLTLDVDYTYEPTTMSVELLWTPAHGATLSATYDAAVCGS